jgi:hypothetical protein
MVPKTRSSMIRKSKPTKSSRKVGKITKKISKSHKEEKGRDSEYHKFKHK